MSTAPEKLAAVLRPYLPLLEADEPLGIDADLAGLGLDSMRTVQLLLQIEGTLDLTFADDDVRPETFATPRALLDAIAATEARRDR